MMRFHHINLLFLGICVLALYCWAPLRAQQYVLHEVSEQVRTQAASQNDALNLLETERVRHQVDILARTLYGEARGEGPQGMEAVGHVILNRVNHQKWGQNIAEVAQRKEQFSCWNHYDHNSRLIRRVDLTDPKFMEAFRIAQKLVLRDLRDDPTRGATHFHNIYVAPPWRDGMIQTARIGGHVFYRDKSILVEEVSRRSALVLDVLPG